MGGDQGGCDYQKARITGPSWRLLTVEFRRKIGSGMTPRFLAHMAGATHREGEAEEKHILGVGRGNQELSSAL